MEIFRDRRNGKIWLLQQNYVDKILFRFGMNSVKLVSVPFTSHFNLPSSLFPSTKEEKEHMSSISYVNVVRSLMYAMVSTRPNISHVVGAFSKDMENLGKEHWETMKWVLRYLRGTSDHCITYNSSCELVHGYVDPDFVGDLDKRRSI
jgi:ATP-binding cassette subfamily B (MDR/TAP) protein 1